MKKRIAQMCKAITKTIIKTTAITVVALSANVTFAQTTQSTQTTQDKTSVWKVSKTIDGKEQVVYFGGTIHLLRSTDYPLPVAFENAYKKADELFFEVDIEEANTQATQMKIMQGLLLKNGETIEDKLNKENYAQLEAYLAKVGMPIDQMKLFTPEGLSLILGSQAVLGLGFTPQGVDQFYDDKAKKDGKKRGFLETIDEQVGFLTNMKADANKVMKYTFKDINNLKKLMGDMVKSWREGTEIEAIAKEMKDDFPQIYQSLIVTRNKNWISTIEKQFLDDETEFVLVGVGHLTGDDSVLSMLENKGYLVEQLDN